MTDEALNRWNSIIKLMDSKTATSKYNKSNKVKEDNIL